MLPIMIKAGHSSCSPVDSMSTKLQHLRYEWPPYPTSPYLIVLLAMKFLAAAFFLPLCVLAQVPEFMPCGISRDPPVDSVAVQVVFGAVYTWDVVTSNETARLQVCQLTPQAVAYGIDVSPSAVYTKQLVPIQKNNSIYMTVVYLYIPKEKSDLFLARMRDHSPDFFTIPDPDLQALVAVVDGYASALATTRKPPTVS